MAKKQIDLIEPEPAIKEIDKAAEALREVRSDRMELTERETKAQDKLVSVMKKHGKMEYVYTEDEVKYRVKLKHIEEAEKVSVRQLSSKSDED